MSQTRGVRSFECEIQARLRDVNLGGHVDSVEAMRIVDEARILFLRFATLDGRPGGGRLSVPPRVHDLEVTAADEHASVQLRVAVPRLAWALRGGGVAEAFSDVCGSIGLDDVDDRGVDALLVRTRRPAKVSLALETLEGQQLQSLGPHETKGNDGRWAFPLNRFLDTARILSISAR